MWDITLYVLFHGVKNKIRIMRYKLSSEKECLNCEIIIIIIIIIL